MGRPQFGCGQLITNNHCLRFGRRAKMSYGQQPAIDIWWQRMIILVRAAMRTAGVQCQFIEASWARVTRHERLDFDDAHARCAGRSFSGCLPDRRSYACRRLDSRSDSESPTGVRNSAA